MKLQPGDIKINDTLYILNGYHLYLIYYKPNIEFGRPNGYNEISKDYHF